MKLTLFKDLTGIVHGADPKRISCDRSGTLWIGETDIKAVAGVINILPSLYYGATGSYPAKFIDMGGTEYNLGTVTLKDGRIVPPSSYEVELMELRCRADEAEAKLKELSEIFDTDALNFLIK